MRLLAAVLGPTLLVSCCGVRAADRPMPREALAAKLASALDEGGAGYEGVVAPPFVVVTNGPPSLVREAEATIVWARDGLRQDLSRAARARCPSSRR